MGTDRAVWRVALAIAALYLLALAPVYGDNDNRHHALTRAVYERGAVEVGGLPLPTADLVTRDGKIYVAAGPGLPFLGLVGYAPVRSVADQVVPERSALLGFLAALVTGSVLPCAMALVAFGRFTESVRPDLVTERDESLVLLGLTASLLPFASRYMTPGLAIASGLLAFVSAARAARDELGWRYGFLAGIFAGVAVATDYSPALTAIGLVVRLLVPSAGRARRVGSYVAGLVLVGALVATYHQIAYGSPLTTGFGLYNAQSTAWKGKNYLGYGWPNATFTFRLTFGDRAGLFLFNPALLVGVAGAAIAARDGDRAARADAAAALGLFAALFLHNASRVNDHEGWYTFGQRYLSPAVPFAAVFLPHALSRARPGFRLALLVISVAIAWVGVQSQTYTWVGSERGPTLWDRILTVAPAGPRLCWLYVCKRDLGLAPTSVPMVSAILVFVWSAVVMGLSRRRALPRPFDPAFWAAAVIAGLTLLHLKAGT